jgi:predicted transcriptional regulator
MFGANLSFKLLEKYLEVVVSAGFVQIDGSVYILTDAGRDFLRAYGDFRERYVKVQKLNDAFSSEYEKTVHFFEK